LNKTFDNSTGQPIPACCCKNNYTGVLCGIPPGKNECDLDSECRAINNCSTGKCVNNSCVFDQKICDDNNNCTVDSCDPVIGDCVFIDQSAKCNDNLQCTNDTCDPSTGQCTNVVDVNCSGYEDICHTSFCDDYQENVSLLCVRQNIVCPTSNNCTISICYLNYTDSQGNLKEGCKNTTYDCAFGFFGIVAGLVGGAIAGIVIAGAIILCGAMVGGSAYAISSNQGNDKEQKVSINPLYRKGGKSGTGVDC